MIAEKSPLVSVIIPIHNRFALIDESVQSVFEQTHRPIKLILVDDHSDIPYTPKISTQPGFDVKVFRHEENKGPGASRETGRQAASGEYIAYLDSDDLWHPHKLEKQVAMLKAHPEAGMCYCISNEFSQLPLNGNELIRKRSDQEFKDFLPTIFYGRPWDTSACLWTRKATDKIGPWLNAWTWEDHEYECRAGCRDIQIAHIPEVLCFYRSNHGESQLSQTTYSEKLVKITESILQMNSNLKSSNKINIIEVHDQFIKILFFHALHLFNVDKKSLGLRMLKEVIRISKGFRKILSFKIYLLSPFLRSTQLGHLANKFRKIF